MFKHTQQQYYHYLVTFNTVYLVNFTTEAVEFTDLFINGRDLWLYYKFNLLKTRLTNILDFFSGENWSHSPFFLLVHSNQVNLEVNYGLSCITNTLF